LANNRIFVLVKDSNARSNSNSACGYLKGQHRNAVIYTNNHYGDKEYRRNYLRTAAENGFELWGGAHRVTINDCVTCQACIQVRIRVRDFPDTVNRLQVMRRHADIRTSHAATDVNDEQYALYMSYQKSRFPLDARLVQGEYKDRMNDWSRMQVMRSQGGLAGVLYYEDCGSALIVGSQYYDRTSDTKRSFGSFGLLSLVKMAKERGDVDYIYLGPWVKDSDSLDYKKKFYPLEGFDGQNWVLLDPEKEWVAQPRELKNIIYLSPDP
jgi:arginyl-tRNA--protein-N-Asp/Glu arginylyltransferase